MGKVLACLTALALSCSSGFAEPDFNRLADAIYKAEGGSKTSHPYGILKKYRNTSPRQACLNTIRHKYRDWVSSDSKKPFLAYLRDKYAPLNALNDPTGL